LKLKFPPNSSLPAGRKSRNTQWRRGQAAGNQASNDQSNEGSTKQQTQREREGSKRPASDYPKDQLCKQQKRAEQWSNQTTKFPSSDNPSKRGKLTKHPIIQQAAKDRTLITSRVPSNHDDGTCRIVIWARSCLDLERFEDIELVQHTSSTFDRSILEIEVLSKQFLYYTARSMSSRRLASCQLVLYCSLNEQSSTRSRLSIILLVR
jgi:hypothetical protein